MPSPRKPWWQQATALVSLGTGGAITGFAFAHGSADHLASPASVPVTLTALDQAAQPPTAQAASEDSVARSAIVKVASYYARLAQSKTPAEMEALIWQQDSADGTDHGQSCAAFASMTLQLGAQLAGKQSWVTGGSTYPWPLHDWVDARVDPNSDSLNITSVLQDAQNHHRWHALGDGYEPLPGDWVVFDNHVEVVTAFSGGVLSTIGGDSLPNFSVNSHEYSGSLGSHGVQGFVSNGDLPAATTDASTQQAPSAPKPKAAAAKPKKTPAAATQQADRQSEDALAAIPGTSAQTVAAASDWSSTAGSGKAGSGSGSAAGTAAIPGMPSGSGSASASASASRPASASPSASASASASSSRSDQPQARSTRQPQAQPSASIPGVPTATPATAGSASASAPAVAPAPAPAPAAKAKPTTKPKASTQPATKAAPSYQRHQASTPSSAASPGTAAQRAFIDAIAPGALAAQRTYGVPAAVTIAQAIDESDWGRSSLASEDHNLFGIKGTGPAGTVALPTHEVYDGETVSITAQFRVYDDLGQ
ncbi:MAG TPA: glucosaminidase domain-containing protein, partial [Streptosporangiaceae bacterium]